jgi:glycosyltransferase involved in cell wall biosynthesis
MTWADMADGLTTACEPTSANARTEVSIGAPPGRLRIVHIAKHCGYGNGSVHVAVDLACVQAHAGHDVVFASGGGTFVPMLEQHGVRHVTMRQDQRRPLTLVRAAVQLAGLCRRERPDILHAHMMGSAAIGYVASRLHRIPLVTTVHNSFDRHSVLMRLGDRVVAVSQAERDHLIRRGWNPARIDAVWNAPDRSPREAFMKNSGEIVLEGPCIVAICALHRRKGVFDLIDACMEVFAEFPRWRLYIAGEGPDRDELERQAAGRGLAGRVTFLGFVPAPKTLFRQADIFVLASYADPGSLSIGEARAAGCAIIATAVGGTTEMLGHGVAGRLVSPGQPRQLAVQLRQLMDDPAARAALRDAALAGVEVFAAERLVDRYGDVYRKALDEHDRRAVGPVAASRASA